jgi:hypothetical protein
MSWTSHAAEANNQTPDNVSAQLRAAEQRIRELEAKVRHRLRLSRSSSVATRPVSRSRRILSRLIRKGRSWRP